MKKGLIGFVVFLSLFSSALTRFAETDMGYQVKNENEPAPGEAMIADVLIARPIGFVALVFGTAVSIVATPFALVSGTTGDVYGRLVADPFNYTVRRPLGEGW